MALSMGNWDYNLYLWTYFTLLIIKGSCYENHGIPRVAGITVPYNSYKVEFNNCFYHGLFLHVDMKDKRYEKFLDYSYKVDFTHSLGGGNSNIFFLSPRSLGFHDPI